MSTKTTSINFRNGDVPNKIPITGKCISGEIPKWIEGHLYRNGPGIQQIGTTKYHHFFDGLALLHHFIIKDGKAQYQSRHLESDNHTKNMAAQRIIVSEFGTYRYPDPCETLLDKFKSLFSPGRSDNCNVNVAFYGDQLYAMTETTFVRRVDPKDLATIGPKINLNDYMSINHATAHPHTLPDGAVLNMGNNFRKLNGVHYCIVKVPPNYETDETSFKNGKVLAQIPCRWKLNPCYYHSFGLTASNKIIFIEQPYCFNIPRIMASGLTGESVNATMSWYDNQKTRIHVVSIDDTDSADDNNSIIYETQDLFTFHHANAYEEDGCIVMDVAGYNNAKFVGALQDKGKDNVKLEGASARRYILPLQIPKEAKVGKNLVTLSNTKATAKLSQNNGSGQQVVELSPEHFTNSWFEFPRINYKYNGMKYNYLYGVQASQAKMDANLIPEADILVKYDFTTKTKLTWTKPNVLVSEPVFIPNPTLAQPQEDDGVVLSTLLHTNDDKKVSLLVLDAKSMTELALIEFNSVGTVPITFHGQWAGDAEKVHTY